MLALLSLLVIPLLTLSLNAQLPDAPGQVAPKASSAQSEAAQAKCDQSQTTKQPSGEKRSDSSSDGCSQSNDSEGKQTNRMLWVVPNFAAVSANTTLPPLSAHEKFRLAVDDSFDYSSFVWTGIITAQSFALNSDPELGRSAAGYARYYWRAFADGVSGTFFTEAIVPSITHEDPRYFTMGSGGLFRRAGYAISRTFITKTDSGDTSFNWSEVGGNGLEAALSNAYYPPQERGSGQTLRDWGTQMESAALNNLAKEFWPDFRRHVLRQK
jgi:hypothetical protein